MDSAPLAMRQEDSGSLETRPVGFPRQVISIPVVVVVLETPGALETREASTEVVALMGEAAGIGKKRQAGRRERAAVGFRFLASKTFNKFAPTLTNPV